MAIQSGWVGSSAVTETGKRWMSEARIVVGLPANGYMSELIGKGNELLIEYNASNLNFDASSLLDSMRTVSANAGYSWPVPASTNWKIKIGSGVQLVGDYYDSGLDIYALMIFDQADGVAGTITIENNGFIAGRGGGGGWATWNTAGAGSNGSSCIYCHPSIKLKINNLGTIAGGAGGGGAATDSKSTNSGWACGGGGGAPYGYGGTAQNSTTKVNGNAGGLRNGGTGGSYNVVLGGSGGNLGGNGNSGTGGSRVGAGGNQAPAIIGGATITFINRGEIIGAIS